MEVNLHAPGSGRAATHKSLAGAWGIPELMPPDGSGTFKVNFQIYLDGAVNASERGNDERH